MAGLVKVTSEGELVWTGQDTIVVQLGDVLDRGDNEISECCCLMPDTHMNTQVHSASSSRVLRSD